MIELIICEENGIVEGKIRLVTVANIDGFGFLYIVQKFNKKKSLIVR
jgi:hypothetical protein